MSKQTSIEWLIDQVEDFMGLIPVDIIQQAKQMHKEEIEDAHIEGQRVFDKHPHTQWTNDQAEKYYQETYGGNHIGDANKMVEDTPMLDRLKAHLDSITPEQFDKEIDDIIKNDDSVQMLCEDCGMEECECGLTPDELIIKDMHNQITSSQTEISDEGIDKFESFLDREIQLKLSPKDTIERIKWYYQKYFKSKEISDEEIEKWVASTPYYGHCTPEYKEGLDEGAKWYREQLKKK